MEKIKTIVATLTTTGIIIDHETLIMTGLTAATILLSIKLLSTKGV